MGAALVCAWRLGFKAKSVMAIVCRSLFGRLAEKGLRGMNTGAPRAFAPLDASAEERKDHRDWAVVCYYFGLLCAQGGNSSGIKRCIDPV